MEFEKRRKLHYREFEAVKLARKLIEEEDDDEEGNGDETEATKIIVVENETGDKIKPSSTSTSSQMDETDASSK